MNLSFEGLMIDVVVAAKIYPKDPATKEIQEPLFSKRAINLGEKSKTELQKRITKALGHKSKGISTNIADSDDGSFFDIAKSTFQDNSEATFLSASKKLAEKLSKDIGHNPAGILTIIKGRVSASQKPFLVAIKAESQNGFITNETAGSLNIELIEDLFLTDNQKFYKIGLIVLSDNSDAEDIDNYETYLYDHLLTAKETRNAAQYFYNTFLGMSIELSDRKLTQDFFEFTRNFINESGLEDDEKFDLHESLRVELKSNSTQISVTEFSDNHIKDEVTKNSYVTFMKESGFPQNSVTKDTEYVKYKLRTRRKLVFSNQVWLTTPNNDIGDLLDIKEYQDDGTTIFIKGKLLGQT